MIRLRNLPDLIGALLCIGLGFIVSGEAYRLQSYSGSTYVGDHTLPFILAIVFIALGAALLFQSFRSRKAEGEAAAEDPESAAGNSERSRLIFCFVTLFLYVWLLDWLGYVLATLLTSLVLFRLIGFYRWLTSLFFSIVLTGCLYAVFIVWLQITFSSGSLFD
ncbi:tripartite tricarboxylate transporter TctB family protein [Brevibacillus choshinensis]|uniref:Tripartite tricarboxylate transporter TctB family protein n=1 Tax=Brevibacillus choshinensis TaxID=54911 RepID=A0ABX7FN61_BRECH|nr:tripartite tricarboxylate transporter TctB family protein [Brevibacillus choshinensis]QRG66727.1 tripartite tricarboxylate transporter TctB family protein [Brevibacillus choshinensis]